MNKFLTAFIISFALLNNTYAGNPISGFFKKFRNAVSDCQWDEKDEKDLLLIRKEMLNTKYPEMVALSPFTEDDFRTKPYLNEFKFVVVVNNSSPYQHNETLLAKEVVNSLNDFEMTLDAFDFFKKIRQFGFAKKENGKYLLSKIPGAQTIRIYENGRLLRLAAVSTGRGTFELRAKSSACSFRPAKSYYSYTENGYFTFQELIKDYESNDYDADMPNAMFYDRSRGLALHEVFLKEKINALGARASGGCTRLDPDTAETLFGLISATQGAAIPVLKRDGTLELNEDGSIKRKNKEVILLSNGKKMIRPTYSALLIIQPHTVTSTYSSDEQFARFRYINELPKPKHDSIDL